MRITSRQAKVKLIADISKPSDHLFLISQMKCAGKSRGARVIIIAFLNVIMTYFGVNFILGGLHSYA